MDPNKQNQPSNSPEPYGPYGPTSTPQSHRPAAAHPAKKTNRLLIITGSLIGLLLLVMVVSLVVFSGGDKKPVTTKKTDTTKSGGPQPATAIGVEETNNSLSQDVSGLDDNKEFPVDQLSDKSVGL